jgi:large subunit ribosomal protein LP0
MPVQVDKSKITLPGVRLNRTIPERKLEYAKKLKELLREYNTIVIVSVNNVGSKQIAEMRKAFRGKARFLFGKNTLIRKVIRDFVKETRNAKLMNLLDLIKGNSGMCFTNCAVPWLRKEIVSRRKQCAAKAGTVAPVDVVVPAGPTNMEPTQTTFFQSMDIATRINRGQIDIVDDVLLIKQGEKVGLSQAVLLTKLSIRPFFYGMKVRSYYDDGNAYDASVLDITDEMIADSFFQGTRRVAALSFSLNYPTIVNVPHSLINAYKKCLALGLSLNTYTWEKLDTVKKILENPDAFRAAAGGGGGGAPAAAGGGAAAAVDTKDEDKEEESDGAPQANPFGGDEEESEDSD